MVRLPIYLDHHATTPCDARVVEAMLPYFSHVFGNASSLNHRFGQEANEAVQQARLQVAQMIGAEPKEILFTSGGTESNNLALKGAARMNLRHGNRVITLATEHRAVLDPCRRLQREGFDVEFLGVDSLGLADVQQVEDALTPATILVSVMLANNEIGVIQPLAALGKLCKSRGILLHTDATQAVGKIPVDVNELGVDLLSLSGHKIYGPKGIGALYMRSRNPAVRLEPLFDGGGHERGMRSGTLPVPLIVGLGKACAIAAQEMPRESERLLGLRERLWEGLSEQVEGVSLNGHPEQRLPGNLNVSFADVHGEALLMALKDVAVSSGSACTSASVEPSYVLRALGVDDDLAHASIRFGLGRGTSAEEVDYAIRETARAVSRLRSLSPVTMGH